MRTFLAIPINYEDIFIEIGKLPKYFRKTNKNQWHITLKFFGSKSKLEIREIMKKVDSIKLEPIKLFNPRLEFFNNKVLSVVFEYSGNLHIKIKELFGYDKDFKPHLTIARVKGNLDKKDKERLLKGNVESKIEVNEIILYKSVLTPKGPEYEILKKWKIQ